MGIFLKANKPQTGQRTLIFIDEIQNEPRAVEENVALRLWNGPMHADTIVRKSGIAFQLHNIPIYYAGQLHRFLSERLHL